MQGLKAARERLAGLVQKGRDLLNKVESEDRALTVQEREQLQAWESEGKDYVATIERANAFQDMGRVSDDSFARTHIIPTSSNGRRLPDERPRLRVRDNNGNVLNALRHDEPIVARQRSENGIEELGELVRCAVLNDFSGASPSIRNALLGGSDTAGGYLLQPEHSGIVVDLARSASVCLQAGAQTIPMETSELRVATLDSDATGYWRAENQTVTSSDMTFGAITLQAHTLAAIVPVSIELLQDAPNAGNIIAQAITDALGLKLDQAILSGSGAANEPRGIRNWSGVNTVTSVGVPADYVKYGTAVKEVLVDNYAGPISSLAWVGHPRDFAILDGLQDTTNQPLQPTEWVRQLRKFSTTSIATTEGGGSDESYAVIGDFSQVLVGMRTRGVQLRVANDGSVTDSSSTTFNATSQLMRHIVAFLRADSAVLRPTHFTYMSGIKIA